MRHVVIFLMHINLSPRVLQLPVEEDIDLSDVELDDLEKDEL